MGGGRIGDIPFCRFHFPHTRPIHNQKLKKNSRRLTKVCRVVKPTGILNYPISIYLKKKRYLRYINERSISVCHEISLPESFLNKTEIPIPRRIASRSSSSCCTISLICLNALGLIVLILCRIIAYNICYVNVCLLPA